MLSFLLGCQPTPPVIIETDERPDIVLITIDTLRADRIGAYGDMLAKTPNLDKLAQEGWLFTESHAVTPLTLPSHTSILTGLLPKEHGIRDNAGFSLDEKHVTIAEALSDSGYSTGAFVSAFVLSPSWGLDQRFDMYHDPFHPRDLLEVAAFGEAQLPSVEVLNVATQWWRKQPSGTPKFAWLHLYDPHTPWEPPADWDGDPYRGEVAKVDHLLGNLLDLTEDAWVIVTSDHGEGLWEHGEREHGVLLGRGVTRVPLIVRPPGGDSGSARLSQPSIPSTVNKPENVDALLDLRPITGDIKAARIVQTPVSGIDIAPTIAEMAGVSFESSGQSVNGDGNRGTVYAETFFPYYHYGWHPLSMIQDSTQRIEKGQRVEAFDPRTLTSLTPTEDLLSTLSKWQGDLSKPIEPKALSVEEEVALQSLGYQTEFEFPSLETAPDPRDSMAVLQQLQASNQLPVPEAIASLTALIEDQPDLLDAHLSLVYLESAQGNFEAALNRCVDVLRQSPNHSVALNNAVILAHKLKRMEVAISFADQMREANPNDVRPFRYLAAIYAEMEATPKVIDVTGLGLKLEPNDPNLNYLKGLAHAFLAEDVEAIPHLRKAKENGSRANDISLWLGISTERLGDIDGALKHYSQAASDMPLDPRANAKAGLMLVDEDRCLEALPLLINVAGRLQRPEPSIQRALQQCTPEEQSGNQ